VNFISFSEKLYFKFISGPDPVKSFGFDRIQKARLDNLSRLLGEEGNPLHSPDVSPTRLPVRGGLDTTLQVTSKIHNTDRKYWSSGTYLDEKLAAAVAEELVKANLDLEGGNLVLLQQLVVSRRHESVRLRARQRAAQHVAQRNVLEA
jgi:hypothetical protein